MESQINSSTTPNGPGPRSSPTNLWYANRLNQKERNSIIQFTEASEEFNALDPLNSIQQN